MSKKEYNKVSVYLLCSNVENEKEYFKKEVSGPLSLGDSGNLYFRKPKKAHEPSWVKDFFNDNEEVKKLEFVASDAAAVLISNISIDGGTTNFAICFGTGHNLLNSSHIIKDFGLDAAMRSIDPKHISSVNLTSFESTVKNKRIQASELTTLSDYSLKRNHDIMKSISGKSEEVTGSKLISNRMLSGKDSISLSAKVNLSTIKDLLPELLKQYKSDPQNGVQYKSNIEKVVDSLEISKLDMHLLEQIPNSENSIVITIPEIIDETSIETYKLSNKDEIFLFSHEEISGIGSIEELKGISINAIGSDGDIIKSWTLYNCLLAEVSNVDTNTYILQEGVYYKINTSYKDAVERCYNGATVEKTFSLNDWDGCCEEDYNSRQKSDSIMVMDKKLVSLGGRSKFEFCDLLTKNKQLVHIKILSNSTNISHLFEQGLLSISVLEEKAKHKVINEIISEDGGESYRIPDDASAQDYSIIYVLLCDSSKIDSDGRPKIPFFSKAVFKEVYEALEAKGVSSSIMAIKKVLKTKSGEVTKDEAPAS